MKQVWRAILFLCCLFLIASCEVTNSHYRTPAEQASAMLQLGVEKDEAFYQSSKNTQLPAEIKKSLIPGLEPTEEQAQDNSNVYGVYGKRFNVKVDNIDAKIFFKNLSQAMETSIILDPKVTGNITLKLKNASVTDILEALRDMYGYDYKQTTYGFFILPPELQTQTFHINYLDIVRNSNSYTQISTDQMFTANSGDISNATSPSPNTSPSTSSISKSQVTTNVQLNFWTELTTSLQALVGTAEGRSVIVNPGSGTIIVKAFPSELRQVSEFLDQIQSNMSREVILEVKLLEVRLNDQYEAGINWDVFGFKQGDILNVISNGAVTAPPLTSVNIHGSNFTNVMNLLEQQGTVQTIANPRVLTVNNQQAVIRIGTDQFFVTGITTNVNNNGSTNTVTTASVGLTPFFSGVILDITPQIGRNGDILLHLHPVVSDVTEETKRIDIGATQPMELPLAKNNIREYDSIVRAENNQIILIGGLTQNTLREEVQGTPGASHIPFVGGLFRNTGQASDKVELVILLKPTVLGRGRTIMTQQLPMAAARISQLDRGFQFGSMPEIFGNQAEIPNYERDTGQLNEE